MIAESPLTSMTDNFHAFPAADITATNFSELQRETYFHCQQNRGKLSVICSGRPIEMEKPHILT
jgi:hypothetical protein